MLMVSMHLTSDSSSYSPLGGLPWFAFGVAEKKLRTTAPSLDLVVGLSQPAGR